ADVERHPRTDLAGDSRRGDDPRDDLDPAADHAGAPASPLGTAARAQPRMIDAPPVSARADIHPTAAAPPDELIACTICDALHRLSEVPEGGRLRCRRCGAVLIRSEHGSLD